MAWWGRAESKVIVLFLTESDKEKDREHTYTHAHTYINTLVMYILSAAS